MSPVYNYFPASIKPEHMRAHDNIETLDKLTEDHLNKIEDSHTKGTSHDTQIADLEERVSKLEESNGT